MGLPKSKHSFTVKETHVIIDSGMRFPCNWDYAKSAVKSGDLIYTGGHRNYKGILVHYYKPG